MRTFLYPLFLLTICANAGSAQSTQYLDAGNIRSLIRTRNIMWWDTATGNAQCEYPKASGKHVGFAAAVWVGGYDGQGQLRVTGQLYGQSGSDFFAGPIDAMGTSTTAAQAAWNRVWSVNRMQLDTFFSASVHTIANTPQAILEWPGKGNPNAKGANGATLSVTADAAPFVDVNSDGLYNPLQGDYPTLLGDQTLWHVFNDVGGAKTATNTAAMPVQISALAWAYRRNTVADNIQFYEYTITNRGAALDSTAVSLFCDMDLGFSVDDYIGFDSARRLGYQYNASTTDGVIGQAGAYGTNIPVAGVAILNAVGDDVAAGLRVPTGAFTYFSNSSGPAEIQDPATGLQYYRYMTGSNKSGNPFTNDFTGVANVPTKGFGTGPNSRYVFHGDPSVNGTWSECYSVNPSGDRRFVISSDDFSLPAGGTRKLAMALVVSPNAGGCPAVSLTGIRQTTDTAYKLYDNPPPYVPTPLAIREGAVTQALTVYPNPVHGMLAIRHDAQPGEVVEVLDAAGRILNVAVARTREGYAVITALLPVGVYAVRLRSVDGVWTATFVKE